MSCIAAGRPDGSVAFVNTQDATENCRMGGDSWRGPSTIRVALSAAAAAGGSAASVANPLGRAILIRRCMLDRTAGTTGTLDVGVAANGTTTSDTLMDGLAATATLFDNTLAADAGTNGRPRQRWAATEFVTATPSVTPTGLVGFLYIEIMDP